MQYRQQALSKIQAGDELGNPVRLTTPQTWIVLVMLVLVILASGAWAILGSLPQKVDAPGILIHQLGASAVYSTATGQISEIFIEPGQTIRAGANVASLTSGDTTTVRAVVAGQVTEVAVAVGQYVTVGELLARVDTIDGDSDRLMAIVYVPVGSGASIRTGADVDLSLEAAPDAGLYGDLCNGMPGSSVITGNSRLHR